MMFQKHMHLAILVSGALAVSACAVSDVGEVDARKFKVVADADDPSKDYVSGGKYGPIHGQKCDGFIGKDPKAAPLQNGLNSNLVGLGRARQGSSSLKAGDVVSVRMRTAFISNNGYTPENVFTDFDLSAEGLGETTRYFSEGFEHNLEVLVAARVFDYGGDASGFEFGAPGRQAARVIFFSDDVEENQFLSLVNLPIYGPLEYSGAGFGLQLFMLEVDEASQQQKELLSGLASAGAAAAAGAAPVINLLSDLTNGLLENGNQDDRMFEVAVGFDTGFEGATVEFVPFEENLFAFVADHDRERSVPWESLVIHPDTGELWICGDGPADPLGDASPPTSAPDEWRRYRDNTYVVVQVLKGYDGQPASTLKFAEVQAFKDELVKARAAAGGGVPGVLEEKAAELVAKNEFEAARKQLGVLREAMAAKEPNQVRRALSKIGDVVIKLQPDGDPKTPELSSAQFEYLFDNLVDLAEGDITQVDEFTSAHWNGKTVSAFVSFMDQFFPAT